jgi:hypothetical protein
MRKSNGEGVELGLRETAKVDEMHDFQVIVVAIVNDGGEGHDLRVRERGFFFFFFFLMQDENPKNPGFSFRLHKIRNSNTFSIKCI